MHVNGRPLLIATFAAFAATLLVAGITEARGSGDTIANVAAAGKAGAAIADPAQIAMADAANVMRHMANDVEFQKSVLAFANKNDAAGLAAFLQKSAPNSTVRVQSLEDFKATLSFLVKGVTVTLCASDEKKCGGHTASISFD
jgi:hypothetical protein